MFSHVFPLFWPENQANCGSSMCSLFHPQPSAAWPSHHNWPNTNAYDVDETSELCHKQLNHQSSPKSITNTKQHLQKHVSEKLMDFHVRSFLDNFPNHETSCARTWCDFCLWVVETCWDPTQGKHSHQPWLWVVTSSHVKSWLAACWYGIVSNHYVLNNPKPEKK